MNAPTLNDLLRVFPPARPTIRVMGREISCEIALKKGAKREGNVPQRGGGQASQPGPPPAANADKPTEGGKESANTYGGGGAAGQKRPAPSPAPVRSEAPQKASSNVKEETATKGENAEKAAEGDKAKPRSREGQLAAAIAEAEATGLGKKEARKVARKAIKKELKKKAKERAKVKKEEQAKLDASAAEKKTPATAEETESGDTGVEVDEAEAVDPKAAKLLGDAKTLLIFGVADDLTAKQLQKRVKKVRNCTKRMGVVSG